MGGSSTAMGYETKASGKHRPHRGHTQTIARPRSHHPGPRPPRHPAHTGDYSLATGLGTKAESLSEFVIGQYNALDSSADPDDFVDTDAVFRVGIGKDNYPEPDRKDALTVYKNGTVVISGPVIIAGDLVVNGAGYGPNFTPPPPASPPSPPSEPPAPPPPFYEFVAAHNSSYKCTTSHKYEVFYAAGAKDPDACAAIAAGLPECEAFQAQWLFNEDKLGCSLHSDGCDKPDGHCPDRCKKWGHYACSCCLDPEPQYAPVIGHPPYQYTLFSMLPAHWFPSAPPTPLSPPAPPSTPPMSGRRLSASDGNALEKETPLPTPPAHCTTTPLTPPLTTAEARGDQHEARGEARGDQQEARRPRGGGHGAHAQLRALGAAASGGFQTEPARLTARAASKRPRATTAAGSAARATSVCAQRTRSRSALAPPDWYPSPLSPMCGRYVSDSLSVHSAPHRGRLPLLRTPPPLARRGRAFAPH